MPAMQLLVVEDDANDVALVERALRGALSDLHLYAVHNGVDAALYLNGEAKFANRDRFPLPQAILLDLQMPLFNGFEFLEWLRQQAAAPLRGIPVAVLSSSGRKEDITRAYESGANDYVVKSPNWSEFRDRLRAVALQWSKHTGHPVRKRRG